MEEKKMDVQSIVVDGETYIPSDSAQPIDGEIKIVILQRGWNMVGYFERDGSDCKLKKASVIRRWGTKHGLGEIALNGPTQNTNLDKTYGIVEFDYLTVVATIACEVSKWESVL